MCGFAAELRATGAPDRDALERMGEALAPRGPDGVIEGIEGTGPTLYLGVQWHVETLVDRRRHAALFDALVAAAADESARRAA